MTTFTPHQNQALSAVADWLKAKPGKNGTPQVFRLFGYAGTGKTTLARHIADGVNGNVKFAAFTGKAALVMRNKGCDNASTIHSLIYRTRESGEEQPSFELWDDAPASKARLPPEDPTIAELLAAEGWQPHAVGKWHLGYASWRSLLLLF